MVNELDLEQTCHQRCCVVVQYMCSVATDRPGPGGERSGKGNKKREGNKKRIGKQKSRREKRSKSRKKKRKKTTEGKEGREKETRKGSEEINLLFRLFFC